VLLIALQWMAAQFAKVGLPLPEFIRKRLVGFNNSAKPQLQVDDSCEDGIFCFCKRFARRTHTSSDSSVASTAATSFDEGSEQDNSDGEEEVEHIDNNLERQKELIMGNKKNSAPNMQITGEWWCMPCNEISTSGT